MIVGVPCRSGSTEEDTPFKRNVSVALSGLQCARCGHLGFGLVNKWTITACADPTWGRERMNVWTDLPQRSTNQARPSHVFLLTALHRSGSASFLISLCASLSAAWLECVLSPRPPNAPRKIGLARNGRPAVCVSNVVVAPELRSTHAPRWQSTRRASTEDVSRLGTERDREQDEERGTHNTQKRETQTAAQRDQHGRR